MVMALKKLLKVGSRVIPKCRDVSLPPSLPIAKSSRDLGFCFVFNINT